MLSGDRAAPVPTAEAQQYTWSVRRAVGREEEVCSAATGRRRYQQQGLGSTPGQSGGQWAGKRRCAQRRPGGAGTNSRGSAVHLVSPEGSGQGRGGVLRGDWAAPAPTAGARQYTWSVRRAVGREEEVCSEGTRRRRHQQQGLSSTPGQSGGQWAGKRRCAQRGLGGAGTNSRGSAVHLVSPEGSGQGRGGVLSGDRAAPAPTAGAQQYTWSVRRAVGREEELCSEGTGRRRHQQQGLGSTPGQSGGQWAGKKRCARGDWAAPAPTARARQYTWSVRRAVGREEEVCSEGTGRRRHQQQGLGSTPGQSGGQWAGKRRCARGDWAAPAPTAGAQQYTFSCTVAVVYLFFQKKNLISLYHRDS